MALVGCNETDERTHAYIAMVWVFFLHQNSMILRMICAQISPTPSLVSAAVRFGYHAVKSCFILLFPRSRLLVANISRNQHSYNAHSLPNLVAKMWSPLPTTSRNPFSAPTCGVWSGLNGFAKWNSFRHFVQLSSLSFAFRLRMTHPL